MAKAAQRYYTGLIPCESEMSMPVARGQGWTADIERRRRNKPGSAPEAKREIVIYARSFKTAQHAVYLIVDSHRLLNGEPPLFDDPHVEPEELRPDFRPFLGMRRGSVHTADLPVACHIAANASRDRRFVYAFALYRLSHAIHANAIMDLDPRYYPIQHRSTYAIDHARYAYAIVTAYAAVEQLGLGLNQQAFHEKRWIPSVRQELEQRLQEAGVNLRETVVWQLRGGKTRLEKGRRRTLAQKAIWSFGKLRDEEIAVVDAIAELRFLRSGVAAHRMSDLARVLSVHDVANGQNLARRLLLDRLGVTPDFLRRIRDASLGSAS
jgi:hypothetical protein